jgi:hypothetical protein
MLQAFFRYSTLLQNFGAFTKPTPESSIMFDREFAHKNTNPQKIHCILYHPLIPINES